MFIYGKRPDKPKRAHVSKFRARPKYRPYGPYSYQYAKRRVRIPIIRGDWYLEPRRRRSPLLRLLGKDRLTWDRWLGDWTCSLQKQGFVLHNEAVTSRRTRVTDKGIRKRECVCLQNGDTAVFLYASIHAIPQGPLPCPPQFAKVLHIVRGRRPDSGRKVKRMEGTPMARGILPEGDFPSIRNVMVDFDDSLFCLDPHGVWRESTDESACDLYRAYRDNSPHFKSIRPHRKNGESRGRFSSVLSLVKELNVIHGEDKQHVITSLR